MSTLGVQGWAPHTEQLRVFLEGMQAALENVTTLEIDDTSMTDCLGLQLLGPALPRITLLRVSQHCCMGTFASLGGACSQLTTLHVIVPLSGSLAVDTPTVLPALTHMRFINPNHKAADPSPYACLDLTSSMNVVTYGPITHITVQGYSMTAHAWSLLPLCVQHLEFDTVAVMPVGSKVLPNLLSFKLHSWYNRFHIRGMAAFVRLAPQCKAFELVNRPGNLTLPDPEPYMNSGSQPNVYSDLLMFNNLVADGIIVMPHGLNIALSGRLAGMDHLASMTQFFAGLPVMRSISRLALDFSRSDDAMLPADLAEKVPCMTAFSLFSFDEATEEELLPLTLCKSLHTVSLTAREDILDSSVVISMLRASLPSLSLLRLQLPRDPIHEAQMIDKALSEPLPLIVYPFDDPRMVALAKKQAAGLL